jgi:peptidoglycan/LPS O-acetylase OafA/YrhL
MKFFQFEYTLLDKNDSFLLRGICMIMIILHHTYLDVIKLDNTYYSLLPNYLMDFGYWGTGIFFFLSGFGMYLSLTKNKNIAFDYYKSKFKKLIYPFIACWIIYLSIDMILGNHVLTYDNLIKFCFFSKPYSEAWFFKVIVCIYVILFITFRTPLSKKIKLLYILIICIIYIGAMKYFGFGKYWYNSILNLPLGMFFAYKYNSIKKINWILVFIFCIFGFYISFKFSEVLTSIFFTLICVYIISIIKIKSKVLQYIGQKSLQFYLFQTPISYVNCVIIYPIALLCLYFSHRLIEKSILTYLYNRTEKTISRK